MAEADHKPEGRHCTKCGEFKIFERFGKATKGRWGRKSVCIPCEKEYIRKNYKKLRSYWTERQKRIRAEERAARLFYTVPFPETMKVCGRCKKLMLKTNFYACVTCSDGLQSQCKSCRAKICKQDQIKNRDRVNATRTRRRKATPHKTKEESKKYYRMALDKRGHNFRLRYRVSNNVRRSLKHGKEGRSAYEFLDFTLAELKAHLEKQFLPGMSWDNFSEWDLDHIRPISSFNIQSIGDREFKLAWALANLRPLWREDNRRKCAKITHLI